MELDEDVVILGCTLWSYLSKQDFVAGMKILPAVSFVKHSKTILLHPRITNKIHLMHKKWLYAMFEKFAGRKIIVVSHYVPSLKGIDAKYSFFNKDRSLSFNDGPLPMIKHLPKYLFANFLCIF